jgi:hypothetical protein
MDALVRVPASAVVTLMVQVKDFKTGWTVVPRMCWSPRVLGVATGFGLHTESVPEGLQLGWGEVELADPAPVGPLGLGPELMELHAAALAVWGDGEAQLEVGAVDDIHFVSYAW